MGNIHFPIGTLNPTLSEVVGYKSGMALTREQMLAHLEDPEEASVLVKSDEYSIRLRSEVFEGLVLNLLYKLGRVESPEVILPMTSVFLKYRSDPIKSSIALDVMEKFARFLNEATAKREKGMDIDPTPFLDEALSKHGLFGAEIGVELCKSINASIEASPWSALRSIEWQDIRQLEELFDSESLTTKHGKFFDQRFIDYLHRNFNRIDDIHWRQFEGLAAEFFAKSDFHVEVGPGRNDGNIDIRVWRPNTEAGGPPTILIQCKRERAKVSKVVVKALYADIVEEKAESGLIVTSSRLSPGAEQVSVARKYPIQEANRETLKQWIEVMRMPGTGVFLGQ